MHPAGSKWRAVRRPRWSTGIAALPGLGVLALIVFVLVPLPPGLLDLLLSASLGGAVLLLTATLTVRRPTDLLTFPTLLLIATLLRLALNVSTTRLILSTANAGRVVDAFANVVAAQDIVVGAVMFAIITLLQYLVVAKGSERVAEVAARFALDGMPGAQSAIDADLRSGVLSASQAAARRAELTERSHFYGAMDGAIRFVKGDAVVGLAITSINLLGGLAIGVLRRDLDVLEALAVYGRLTIGDGLVAQVPAVLTALAAGVLVTRVERRSGPQSRESWVTPTSLIVPGCLLAGVAWVPGMPTLAFSALGAGFFAAAGWRHQVRELGEPRTRRTGLRCAVSPLLVPDLRAFERQLGPLRAELAAALGVKVPRIRVTHDHRLTTPGLVLTYEGRLLGRQAGVPGSDGALVAIYRAVIQRGDALVTVQSVDEAINVARGHYPATVNEALARVGVADITAICRAFVRARLPMPPVAALLEVVATHAAFRSRDDESRWVGIAREQLADHWLPPLLGSTDGPWRAADPDFCEALAVATRAEGQDVSLKGSAHNLRHWREALAPTSPARVVVTPAALPGATALLCGDDRAAIVVTRAELARASHEPSDVTWVPEPEPA